MEIVFYFLFFVLTELIIERGGYALGCVLRLTSVGAMPRNSETERYSSTSVLEAVANRTVFCEVDGRRYLPASFVVLLGWGTVALVGAFLFAMKTWLLQRTLSL